MKEKILFIAVAATSFAFADVCSVKMLPGEKWWGVCNSFGRDMPFSEKSDFSCDLRLDNYSHQSLSFLCSDKGRTIWCKEPVGVVIKDGKIAFESDKGEIVVKDNAGRNLAEAFLDVLEGKPSRSTKWALVRSERYIKGRIWVTPVRSK